MNEIGCELLFADGANEHTGVRLLLGLLRTLKRSIIKLKKGTYLILQVCLLTQHLQRDISLLLIALQ